MFGTRRTLTVCQLFLMLCAVAPLAAQQVDQPGFSQLLVSGAEDKDVRRIADLERGGTVHLDVHGVPQMPFLLMAAPRFSAKGWAAPGLGGQYIDLEWSSAYELMGENSWEFNVLDGEGWRGFDFQLPGDVPLGTKVAVQVAVLDPTDFYPVPLRLSAATVGRVVR